MEPQDITPDVMRVLFADFPAWYPLEIAFRTVIMYLFVLLALRFLGKREISELSLFEFAIVIALGSAVGDPMFYHDVPIVNGVTVVAVVVMAQRLLQTILQRSHRFERIIEGQPSILVSDGIINTGVLTKERISYDELFTALRGDGIEQLGQVRRAILETSGQISTFAFAPEEARDGLTLLPTIDPDYPPVTPAGTIADQPQTLACNKCGKVEKVIDRAPVCSHCQNKEWIPATKGLLP